MNILITILLVVAGLIVLVLVIAFLVKKEYNVQSEITINAPVQKVFDYVKHIKNQDYYSKWVMTDPGMKKDFNGIDGTVGFIYAWNGNKKAGEGEQEIKTIVEGKHIDTEVRFVRPFAGTAYGSMKTEPVSGNQTRLQWSNASKIKFPLNFMILFIEKMLIKDMDESLIMLKAILEKN